MRTLDDFYWDTCMHVGCSVVTGWNLLQGFFLGLSLKKEKIIFWVSIVNAIMSGSLGEFECVTLFGASL